MSGKLITLEGLDGSGKATQTEFLCKELAGKGIRVRKISFPDYGQPSSALAKMYLDGKFGENPEDVSAYAASSFYAVDRFASYAQFWKEDYQSGAVIVADRYSTSNIVFQMSKLPRDEWDAFIQWVQDYEYNKLGLPQPDCTVYLDMPPLCESKASERALSRRRAKEGYPRAQYGLSARLPGKCGLRCKNARLAGYKLRRGRQC